MPNKVKADILKEELLNYFYDKRFDMSQVVDFLYDTIENFVDCDFEKLASVLRSLTAIKSEKSDLKNEQFFSAAQNRVFDISSEFSKIMVKEILSEKKVSKDNKTTSETSESNPVLFFYKDDDKLPFLKIISNLQDNSKRKITLEHSNCPELLTTKKDRGNESGYKYIFKDVYLCDTSGDVVAKRYTYAKSGNDEEQYLEDLYDLKDIEFCKFTSFLTKLLNKFNKDNKFLISGHHTELLESFYYNVESAINEDMGFRFNDLIEIIDSLLIENKNKEQELGAEEDLILETLTHAAENIAGKKDDEIEFDMTSFSNSGDPLYLRCSKNNQYLRINIENISNLNKCTYLIYETINGFTIFRNIEGDSIDKNILSSYTLSLSNSILKFSAIGKSETLPNDLTPIDVQLILKEDGSYGFYCENVAEYSNSSMTFGVERDFS